jgi:hypothetical protein
MHLDGRLQNKHLFHHSFTRLPGQFVQAYMVSFIWILHGIDRRFFQVFESDEYSPTSELLLINLMFNMFFINKLILKN